MALIRPEACQGPRAPSERGAACRSAAKSNQTNQKDETEAIELHECPFHIARLLFQTINVEIIQLKSTPKSTTTTTTTTTSQ